MQEVVEALRLRREARSRRPMMLLGGLGPVLLLAVMAVFAMRGYRQATEQSADAIRRRAYESNKFAAAFIARSLEAEIRRYLEVVSEEAARPDFRTAFRTATALPDLARLTSTGADRQAAAPAALVERFLADPARMALDAHFGARLNVHLDETRRDPKAPRFVSMFALDADGTHLGAAYSEPVRTKSVGRYYAWRSYFHGGPEDLPRNTPRARITPIEQPHLSAPFRSTTTNAWRLGVSTPLFETRADGEQPLFVGVLVLSVDIGNFEFLTVEGQPARDRFAVLVDARTRGGSRPGDGRILLHPYFAEVARPDPNDPRPALSPWIERGLLRRMTQDWRLAYHDPLARAPGGATYRGAWIAAAQPLGLPSAPAAPAEASWPDALVVLVQERSEAATGPVVQLGTQLMHEGLAALLAIAFTVAALWLFVLRGRSPRGDRSLAHNPAAPIGPRPLRDRSTLSETGPDHG